MIVSAARILVSVTTAVCITLALGTMEATGGTVAEQNYGARIADALEIHAYQGQNAGFVIGRPCHNIGFELYGTPGDPSFFFDTCD